MEKKGLPTIYIKHRGFFDFSKALKTIGTFYREEDFHMVYFPKHKAKPPRATGVEHEIEYEGKKRVTDYIMLHINVFFHVFDLRDVEIIRDGKKLKLQEGKVAVEIYPMLELDYQKRFDGNKFLQWLQDFYHNYIIKYKIGDYWEDMVFIKANEMAKQIQSALGQEVP